MSIAFLLFCFVAAFLLICLLVLFFLSERPQAKGWYLFFMLGLIGWLWLLLAKPQWVGPFWLLIVPLLWLAGSLKVSFPLAGAGKIPTYPDEPRVTQEDLRGRAGTLEALRLYFFLVMVALLIGLAVFTPVLS